MTTDRDRETARKLWRAARYADPADAPEVEDVIATAIAAERDRVLAPVLVALDALSRETGAYEAGYKSWAQTVIREVRRAAQDGEPE